MSPGATKLHQGWRQYCRQDEFLSVVSGCSADSERALLLGYLPCISSSNTKEKHPLLVTLAKDQFQRALGSSLVLPPLQPTQSIRQGLCIVKLYLIADIPSCLVPVSCSLSPSLAPSFSLSPPPAHTNTRTHREGAPPSPNRCRER